MSWKLTLVLSWGLLAWTAGCQPAVARGESAEDSGGRPRIVATTSLIGNVLSRVGGDRIELRVLLPPGADPHSFQSTPQDAAAVAEAQLVFINGFGLEEALLATVASVAGSFPLVSISEGIEPRELAAAEGGQGEASTADPHVWLDPTNVMVWVENARAALTRVDLAGADLYAANATAYQAALEALDGWIRSEVERIPSENRELVTDHDNLGYFAARYGFRIVGAVIPAYSTLAQPSAQEIAELEQTIARYEVPAFFVGVTANPALSERVAQDMGVALVPIYTDSLSGPEGPAATYLEMMRYTVRAIVEALSPS
ncbi:MAG: metal ABC transporter solute-binding protein, Zn/Mn family [Anaerolineales bacterium]